MGKLNTCNQIGWHGYFSFTLAEVFDQANCNNMASVIPDYHYTGELFSLSISDSPSNKKF